MVLHCILHGIITFNFITFQWLATGQVFSPGTPVSSTNKTDRHDIYNWNNVESGVKHHKPITCLFICTYISSFVFGVLFFTHACKCEISSSYVLFAENIKIKSPGRISYNFISSLITFILCHLITYYWCMQANKFQGSKMCLIHA